MNKEWPIRVSLGSQQQHHVLDCLYLQREAERLGESCQLYTSQAHRTQRERETVSRKHETHEQHSLLGVQDLLPAHLAQALFVGTVVTVLREEGDKDSVIQ